MQESRPDAPNRGGMLRFLLLVLLIMTLSPPMSADAASHPPSPRYQFVGMTRFDHFAATDGPQEGQQTLTSPEITPGGVWDELIVSWNADTPAGASLSIQARALSDGHATRWYDMGFWAGTGHTPPRTSVKDQKDADGEVDTDTLTLITPAPRVQVRVIADGPARLTFLGLTLTNRSAASHDRMPNKSVWGRELAVPARSQLSYTDGNGWCSPTSVSMTLGYWARQAHRPEWDVDVPQCAAAIYDDAWQGTGNWPFNTAFAGSLPGLRAYVTRLDSLRDVEDWLARGVPVILSVSVKVGNGDEPGPNGHLVVCTGFTPTGDLIVNDPWAHLDKGEHVRRIYRRSHMDALWRKSKHAVYIIHPIDLHPPQEDSFS